MLVNKSILETDFEPLLGSDAVATVKERIEKEQVRTLPVVNETTQKLIGQLEARQLDEQSDKKKVSEIELQEAIKIYEGQHVFEAARLMLQYELRMLPVVDEEWTFLGILSKQKVLESLSRMLNLEEFGSVITVELDPIDFTISEIVQIIETEGAKILGVTVEMPDSEKRKFKVSFKLNVEEVSRVAAALRRYDYAVLTQSGSTVFGDDLKERADELLKYIDM